MKKKKPLESSSKPCVKLGIRFRNESHYFWFRLSLVIVLVSTLWSVSEKTIFPMLCAETFFIFGGLWAVVFTKSGQMETKLFSTDCIWWNWSLFVVVMVLRKLLFS